jgi:polyferredoxin
MDKMGYPKGLVRYTTENAVQGRVTHVVRPRMFVYAALLVFISSALIYAIAQRIPLELDVIRDRNALYRETAEGLIENVYTLKIVNMDQSSHRFELDVSGLEGLELNTRSSEILVRSGEVLNLPVQVRIDPVNLTGMSNEISFRIVALNNPDMARIESARFLGPRVR